MVGVIAADSALNIGDYRAEERTFQTIIQVAGRAGREKENGDVVVQTYNPDNYAIICSKEQDYEKFYKGELELRKSLNYPPFCDIIMINFVGTDLNEINIISNIVYKKIVLNNTNNLKIFKPVPAPIDKINNKFRWRIIIKCKISNRIIDIVSLGITDEKISKSKNTKITVDINPNTMS